MLQAIRSRAGSLVVKILFGLLILTFGAWGIGDIFSNRPAERVVATVGDQSIRAEELQAALRPALDVENVRIGKFASVAISRAECEHDLVAGTQRLSVQICLAHGDALEALRRGIESK